MFCFTFYRIAWNDKLIDARGQRTIVSAEISFK